MNRIKIKKTRNSRIRQGDIFRDVEYIESITEKAGVIEVSKIIFPLVIVLTQDCDLEQDHRFRQPEYTNKTQDKWLISVLVAPLYNAEHFHRGEHLIEIGQKMQVVPWNKSDGQNIRNNERPRYHYLEFADDVNVVASVADFKHYFSVNVQYLKKIRKTNFVCCVSDLFREDISLRFANFLARIGLPEWEKKISKSHLRPSLSGKEPLLGLAKSGVGELAGRRTAEKPGLSPGFSALTT